MLKCLFLLAWSSVAHATGLDDLEALVARAEASSPTLDARVRGAAGQSAMASVAGAWSDPMLTVGAMNFPTRPSDLHGMAMTGVFVGVSQTLPTSGAPRHATRVAASRAEVRAHESEEARLQVGLAVRVAFWRLALVRQLQQVLSRHVDAADALLGAVRARYEVGGVGQSGLLRMDLLREQLIEDLADLRRDEAELIAALRRALADPAAAIDTPLETPPRPLEGDATAWLAAAERDRPLLGALAAEVERAEAEAGLARARGAPDVTVGASYLRRVPIGDMPAGSDLFSVEAMVPIPLASSKVALGQRAAALHEADGGRARLSATRDAIRADLEAIHARWARAEERAERLRSTLVPEAERARDTTLSDFRVGKADFASLYEAEVTLLELERSARTAAVDTRIHHALATASIGSPPTGAN